MSILIKNGRVIDPSQQMDRVTNLLIEEGRIAAFDAPDSSASGNGAETIDGAATLVLSTAGAGVALYCSGTEWITVPFDMQGRDISVDGTKLDAIEAAADVTDDANVRTALAAATATVNFNGQVLNGPGDHVVGHSRLHLIGHPKPIGPIQIAQQSPVQMPG